MTIWRPGLAKEKYEQTILFLLNSSANNPLLGKVKLFKLLYYADFDHYQAFKSPITGDIYYKYPYGPVPSNAETMLANMQKLELISITTKHIGPYMQYEFRALAEANIEVFRTSEMKVLEQVVDKWANHTKNEIVSATHGEAPWRAVEMWEEIPYALAFYRRAVVDEENDEELTKELVG